MTIKVAINGFGRIGRNILRAYYLESSRRSELEIVAINDLGCPKIHSHLLKYDSVHGVIEKSITSNASSITVDDHEILYFSSDDPSALPWSELNIDLVLECTGHFTERDNAAKHINAGAKKVLISAPSNDADQMVVFGVNHLTIQPSDQIISNASCTTNCLAPLVKCLNESMQISSGIINTIHAATNDQNVLDNYHSDPYRARSSFESLIPTKTGAASAIGKIIPELNGKLTGLATRVPVTNVSMLDFTFTAKNILTIDELKELLLNASNTSLKNILSINDDPLVSSDFNGKKASCIVDFNFIEKVENQYKLIAWYDNESGFSNRMIDLAKYWLDLEYGDINIKKVI